MIVAVAAAALVVACALVIALGMVNARRLAAVRGEEEARRLAAAADEQAAEAELRSSRLEQVLGSIPSGVVIVDERGEVVLRNAVAEEYASARHSEALVSAELEELVSEAMAGRQGSRIVELFGPPRRTLVVRALPLRSELGVGALGIIEDISELRHLEAVRRDFVANISHELRTPVGALGLLAETLVTEEDPHVTARLASRIGVEAFRVSRTIDELLELSRVESGEVADRSAVPVGVVLAEAIERIRPAADQLGMVIRASEPSPHLAVLGDRLQLVSAVYNLLDNAVKYSEASSEVEVRAGADGTQVSIAVEDQGMGIPARDIDRVFERFYRVDQGRSRDSGGTGLGLAIVRHVVGNHGGEVRVESRLGEGSTFTLLLPLAGRAEAETSVEGGLDG